MTSDGPNESSDDPHSTPLRLFRDLSPAARGEIASSARIVRRARGERLFRQGAAAGYFYLLQSGRVKVTQLSADAHPMLIRLVAPGEAFGGIAALGNKVYPVTAEVAADCVALVWSGGAMDRLLRRHPQLAINLIDLLAERVHDMQLRYEELATQRVEQRLARTLLRLLKSTGHPIDAGVLLDVRLSRQELAEITGTSLFTVSRILTRWRVAGLIHSSRQRILVLRRHALAGIAEDLPGNSRIDID